MRKTMLRHLLGLALPAVLLLLSLPARAEAPAAIPLQGVLTDPQGYPIVGQVTVHFALYPSKASLVALWSETQELTLKDGLFTAYLGADTQLDLGLFSDNDEMWLGITVENDPEMARISLGSSPYAAFAEHCGTVPVHQHTADELAEALPEGLLQGPQKCEVGQVVTGFDAEGNVLCEADQDTTYTGQDFAKSDQWCDEGKVVSGLTPNGTLQCVAQEGTTYSGADFALSNQGCQGTDKVSGIGPDGLLTCAPDKGKTYTGADFVTSGQACPEGQVVKAADANGKLSCSGLTGADVSGKKMLYIQHADCGGSQVPTTTASCKSTKCTIGGFLTGYLNCSAVCTVSAQPLPCDNTPLGYLLSP